MFLFPLAATYFRQFRELRLRKISFKREEKKRNPKSHLEPVYTHPYLVPPFIINHNRHPFTRTNSPWNLVVDLPTVAIHAIHAIVPIHAINAVSISVVEPSITLHGRFLFHPIPIRKHLI